MKPDEINRTIAEAHGVQTEGWWCEHCGREVASAFVTFDETHDKRSEGCGNPVGPMPIPDYYHDLNEIRRVVIRLPEDSHQLYAENLCEIVEFCKHDRARFAWDAINATAPQRCEAYLRTIGKWRDVE